MEITLARSYLYASAPVSHSTSSKLRTGFLPEMPSFSAKGNVREASAMGSPSGDGVGSCHVLSIRPEGGILLEEVKA